MTGLSGMLTARDSKIWARQSECEPEQQNHKDKEVE